MQPAKLDHVEPAACKLDHIEPACNLDHLEPACNPDHLEPACPTIVPPPHDRKRVRLASLQGTMMQHASMFTVESLQQIARSSGKTVAQVVLRWAVQKGVVAIPGTSNPAHMDENLAGVYSFALTTEQMGIIDAVRSDPKAKGFTAMGFEKNES